MIETKGGQKPSRRKRWRKWAPYLFAAPALVLHAFVVVIPSIFTFVISLFDWDGLGKPKYIGLKNFSHMLTDDRIFRISFGNNVKWTIIFLTIPIIMGLGSAVLITNVRRGQMFYRTVFYLPATLASIVVGRLWQWVFHPFSGINSLLTGIGLGTLALDWLSDPKITLYSVAFADNWRWWGFLSVAFLAALTQIDVTLYESAALDGANAWQRFWHITLPSIRPTLVFVGLTTTLGSFLVFDMIFIMTRGGPGNASQTLATWIYFQLINNFSAGYASAVATMTTLLLSAVIAAYVYVRMRGWEI